MVSRIYSTRKKVSVTFAYRRLLISLSHYTIFDEQQQIKSNGWRPQRREPDIIGSLSQQSSSEGKCRPQWCKPQICRPQGCRPNWCKRSKKMNKELFEKVAFDLLKGRANYYMQLSLKRPLTTAELDRYRAICKELGADVS